MLCSRFENSSRTRPAIDRSPRFRRFRWLQPRVLVRSGSFHGEVYPYVQATDFETFLPELRLLRNELRGTASFTTLEDRLRFTLSGDGLGHIKLCGSMADRLGDGNRLEFTISYDQTFLGESNATIEEAVSSNYLRIERKPAQRSS